MLTNNMLITSISKGLKRLKRPKEMSLNYPVEEEERKLLAFRKRGSMAPEQGIPRLPKGSPEWEVVWKFERVTQITLTFPIMYGAEGGGRQTKQFVEKPFDLDDFFYRKGIKDFFFPSAKHGFKSALLLFRKNFHFTIKCRVALAHTSKVLTQNWYSSMFKVTAVTFHLAWLLWNVRIPVFL